MTNNNFFQTSNFDYQKLSLGGQVLGGANLLSTLVIKSYTLCRSLENGNWSVKYPQRKALKREHYLYMRVNLKHI